jgi:hypothetical protein
LNAQKILPDFVVPALRALPAVVRSEGERYLVSGFLSYGEFST